MMSRLVGGERGLGAPARPGAGLSLLFCRPPLAGRQARQQHRYQSNPDPSAEAAL